MNNNNNNHENQQQSERQSVTDQDRTDDGNGTGLADRLTDLFVGDGDDEVLMRRSARGTVVQWLQALDMQVMGACRADERLKPLLKVNVSSGVAEDRLLSHLSQVLMYFNQFVLIR